jgi:hypothetical protein
MGVPASEVGYTSATTRRGGHEDRKGHVGALEKNILEGVPKMGPVNLSVIKI